MKNFISLAILGVVSLICAFPVFACPSFIDCLEEAERKANEAFQEVNNFQVKILSEPVLALMETGTVKQLTRYMKDRQEEVSKAWDEIMPKAKSSPKTSDIHNGVGPAYGKIKPAVGKMEMSRIKVTSGGSFDGGVRPMGRSKIVNSYRRSKSRRSFRSGGGIQARSTHSYRGTSRSRSRSSRGRRVGNFGSWRGKSIRIKSGIRFR